MGIRGTRQQGNGENYLMRILNDLYCSPNIVRVVKSRMRWAGYVARMWERRRIQGFGGETWGEREHLGDPEVDGRIILR